MSTFNVVNHDLTVSGTDSVTTASPPAGMTARVGRVVAYFTTPGASGTLSIKDGATTLWSADVSGGLDQSFPGMSPAGVADGGIPATGPDRPLTLELSGAQLKFFVGVVEVLP